ncbi:FAD-dependent oxidoreductase [Rhodobacteraceae bacterium]|nr:FAD-dependent oxidoreductase [Paracoccaceae bacterium]
MGGVVIVGAGQAGASLAEKLRAEGHADDITLIGAEPEPPYERPPLSKGYLLGDVDKERLYLRPLSVYEDKKITLRLGMGVTKINPASQTISCENEVIAYDQLALTMGSTPNQLPAKIGGDLPGVYTVRALACIDKIEPRFKAGARVLVVGGGYIGLEAAAVAAKLKMNVTLVEMAERILGRVAAEETADVVRARHLSEGVDIREGVGLKKLIGEDHVEGAILTDGTELDVDFVIVGTGIQPVSSLAEDAGIRCDSGIVVDTYGRTSVPNVWAAGDCTRFPYKGEMLRLESVQNAIDQAENVAINMLGANEPYNPYPWFWSDQYDLKLQIAGLNTGYDHVVTRQASEGQSHWYFKDGVFLAVDAINAGRHYMIGKRLLEMGKTITPELAGDEDADLKALLKA